MIVVAPLAVRVSRITLMFGSPSRTRNISVPPIASSGLKITSPCSRWNSRSCAASRLTSSRRAALREAGREQLLVAVAQRLRVVDHQAAVARARLEDVGGVDVLVVERRVLAHQHHVEPAERDLARLGRGRTSAPRRGAPAGRAAFARALPSRRNRSCCSM